MKYLWLLNFLIPTISLAADYTLLAPLGGMVTVNFPTYLGNIFRILVGITGFLAVVMIVICGIQLMTSESVGAKDEAKKCISSSLFGVLLAISSWVILNTINPDLISHEFTTPAITLETPTPPKLEDKDALRPTTPRFYFQYKNEEGFARYGRASTVEACEQLRLDMVNKIGESRIDKVCFEIRKPTQVLTQGEGDVRKALCGNDSCLLQIPLGINKAPCKSVDVYQANCTSVEGFPSDTINLIKSLQSSCGCNILVTGGTEKGHATHAKNLPVFDLRYESGNTKLNNLIMNSKANPSFSGNQKWLYNGYWFTDEKSAVTRHWHVCKEGTAISKAACTKI